VGAGKPWVVVRKLSAEELGGDEVGEGGNVGEQGDADSGEGGKGEAVKEDETEYGAFLAVDLGGGAGDNDAGSGNHLAHDPAGRVG
jgi:hypothetical protein